MSDDARVCPANAPPATTAIACTPVVAPTVRVLAPLHGSGVGSEGAALFAKATKDILSQPFSTYQSGTTGLKRILLKVTFTLGFALGRT